MSLAVWTWRQHIDRYFCDLILPFELVGCSVDGNGYLLDSVEVQSADIQKGTSQSASFVPLRSFVLYVLSYPRRLVLMKILSVGNSFSQDAQRWLHDIAMSDGVGLDCVNLMIGGCSLERHYNNLVSGAEEYGYELNSVNIKNTSLSDGLKAEKWDVITLQQVSQLSGKSETYFPYIEKLNKYIRECCPYAKVYIHETWAYEIDSTHDGFMLYGCDQNVMYKEICASYAGAAKKIGADGIIRTGEVVQYMRTNVPDFDYKNGGLSLNRDGFHLSLDYGRLAAGLCWYDTLLGGDILHNSFVPEIDGVRADESLVAKVRSAVKNALENISEK